MTGTRRTFEGRFRGQGTLVVTFATDGTITGTAANGMPLTGTYEADDRIAILRLTAGSATLETCSTYLYAAGQHFAQNAARSDGTHQGLTGSWRSMYKLTTSTGSVMQSHELWTITNAGGDFEVRYLQGTTPTLNRASITRTDATTATADNGQCVSSFARTLVGDALIRARDFWVP